jgi:hypothetical protein
MNLKQALDIIDSGEVFSLSVVKYDHKRKEGGQKRFYSQVCAVNPKKNWEKTENKPRTNRAGIQNHYDNATRNLYKCIDGIATASITKVHIVHILEVNAERVML